MADNLIPIAKDCLSTIIGLTDIECDCTSDLRPESFSESDSGRFITDPEHGFPVLEAVFHSTNCGGEMWAMLQKARSSAIQDFLSDLQITMQREHDPKVPIWKGEIGKRRWTFNVGLNKENAGIILKFPRWRGARFVLTGIGLNLGAVAPNVQISILANTDEFEPKEFEVDTVSNTTVFVQDDPNDPQFPITLPFFSEQTNELTYVITYAVPAITGITCPENQIFGCCGGLSESIAKVIWAGGFQENDLDTLKYEDISWINSGFGLTLQGYLDCDKTAFLCDLKTLGGEDLFEAAAAAIQAKAAAKVTSMVIDSGQINRFTLKSWEELHGRRQRHNNTYEEYLTGIVKNYRNQLSDCWVCKSKATWRVETIKI